MPMSQEPTGPSTDLIRWTFSVDPARKAAVEEHLNDLGADVLVREGGQFLVTWEEPEGDLEEVVEAIWMLNGAAFEVVQEEFHRLGLHILQHAEDDPARDAA
jgi:hypothetical protein